MPLFDETTARSNSEEVANAYATRDILTNCSALRELLEVASPSAAVPLIVIGEMTPPLNGEGYTIGELESTIAFCQIFPKTDEGGFSVERNTGYVTPKKEGAFWLQIRRQVRQSEYEATDGRNDAWRYFWFLTSQMAEQFIVLTDETDNNPGLVEKKMRRDVMGYDAEHQPTWPQYGYYLFAKFLIPWAGIEGGGEL